MGKAPRGVLRSTRPDDMAAAAIREALRRVPALDSSEVEDVILGCAMPEAEQGNNVARVASLRAGLPVTTSAMTINRFCSSGLQAIALASERILAGSAEVVVAGGTETMSMIPMGGYHFSPNPYLMEHYPDAYLSMGLTAENLAAKHHITREEQDQFSLRSHQRAMAAIEQGKFQRGNCSPGSHRRQLERREQTANAEGDFRRPTKGRGAIRPSRRWRSSSPHFTRMER